MEKIKFTDNRAQVFRNNPLILSCVDEHNSDTTNYFTTSYRFGELVEVGQYDDNSKTLRVDTSKIGYKIEHFHEIKGDVNKEIADYLIDYIADSRRFIEERITLEKGDLSAIKW